MKHQSKHKKESTLKAKKGTFVKQNNVPKLAINPERVVSFQCNCTNKKEEAKRVIKKGRKERR